MPIDPARASFVRQPYRYRTVEDANTRLNYPKAREVVIDTNLDATSAMQLATAIEDANDGPIQVYEVVLKTILNLEDFFPEPPRFSVNFPDYGTDGRIFHLVGATVNYMEGRTTVRIRG